MNCPIGFIGQDRMRVWVKNKPPGYGPQVLVLSIYQGKPFWGYPILDPRPHVAAWPLGARSASRPSRLDANAPRLQTFRPLLVRLEGVAEEVLRCPSDRSCDAWDFGSLVGKAVGRWLPVLLMDPWIGLWLGHKRVQIPGLGPLESTWTPQTPTV